MIKQLTSLAFSVESTYIKPALQTSPSCELKNENKIMSS